MDALPGIDDRPLGGRKNLRGFGDRGGIRGGTALEARRMGPGFGHVFPEHVERHLDEHRPGPAVAQLEKRPPHHLRKRLAMVRGSAHLATWPIFRVELKLGK